MRSVPGVLVAAAKFTLLLLAWGCVAVFQAWNVASVIATWTWAYDDPEAPWEKLRGLLDLKYGMAEDIAPDQSLLYGWDNLNLIFYYLVAFAAAIFASAAFVLPGTRSWESTYRTWSKVWRPFRRILNWQMPLQRWWLSWCAGLSFGEALLWSGWLVVHAVALWDLVNFMFLDAKMAAWRAMGMRPHAPPSVLVLEDISIAFSWILYIDVALMYFPISHNTFLNRLLGIPYAGLIRFHRWISHFALWAIAGHGVFYYLLWICDPTINFWDAFFDWCSIYHIPSLAGSIAFAFGILIWVTSLDWVRRNYFKVFYRCHIIGFTLFTIFAFIHYYWSWFAYFPGLCLWAADIVVRSFYSQKGAHITAMKTSEDGTTMHVDVTLAPKTFRDPMSLRGAHIFLRIPALSRLDWHPFTVADASVDAAGFTTLSLVVKAYDGWTKALGGLAASVLVPGSEAVAASALRVNIWRPFDQIHIDRDAYTDILMLAGGIAVTPVLALLRNIVAEVRAGAAPPRRIRVLFLSRNAEELGAVGPDILKACKEFDWIQLSLHYTGRGVVGTGQPTEGGVPIKAASNDAGGVKGMERSESGSGSDNNSHPSVHTPIPAASSGTGAWGILQRILPVDFLTDGQMIWVVILAFFGAFMGFVLSMAFVQEYLALDNYYPCSYATVGVTVLPIISVNMVGLPAAFVLLPIYVRRLFEWCRGVRTAAPPMRGYLMSPPLHLDQASGKLCCPEAGAALPVESGRRPDLAAAVREFASDAQAAGGKAAVVYAGPRAMMHAVALAVQSVNGVTVCGDGPYVDKYEVAFEF